MNHYKHFPDDNQHNTKSLWSTLFRVFLFIFSCILGAGYYSAVLAWADNGSQLMRVVLIGFPIFLILGGIAVSVLVFFMNHNESASVYPADTSTESLPLVSRLLRGPQIDDSAMNIYALQEAQGLDRDSTSFFSRLTRLMHARSQIITDQDWISDGEDVDIDDVKRQLAQTTTSLLPFKDEVVKSLRELNVTLQFQQDRLTGSINIHQAIEEIERVASRLKEMGATLYRISEYASIRWIWARDLANPGPYQPLQPIVLPQDNTKVNTDQLRRVREGLMTLDTLTSASIRVLLDTLESRQLDEVTMSNTIAEYYGLTRRMLRMEIKLRNILYEQYIDDPITITWNS